jgi:hypothetical protein
MTQTNQVTLRDTLFVVTVVPNNLEVEQAVGHYLPSTDIVYDEIPRIISRLPVYHDANVRNGPTEIPAHDIAGLIIFGAGRDRHDFTFARKKSH